MKLLKSIVGTLAVLFSIQPLVTWAATSGQKGHKQISTVVIDRSEKGTREGGPSCHTGG